MTSTTTTAADTDPGIAGTIRWAIVEYLGLPPDADDYIGRWIEQDEDLRGRLTKRASDFDARYELYRTAVDERMRLGDLQEFAIDAAYWHGQGLPGLANQAARDVAFAAELAINGRADTIRQVFRKAAYDAEERARRRPRATR